MGIESRDVGDAHMYQLLKRHGTVQGLSVGALMLAALVEERHDDIDPVRGGSAGADDSLKILVMVIRGHVVYIACHLIGQGVVCHIHHHEHVCAADRFLNDTLGFAASESRALAV